MDPNVLRRRVRQAISNRIDKVKWRRPQIVERAEVESMHEFHARWQARLDGAE